MGRLASGAHTQCCGGQAASCGGEHHVPRALPVRSVAQVGHCNTLPVTAGPVADESLCP